jgi:hypothetical protein
VLDVGGALLPLTVKSRRAQNPNPMLFLPVFDHGHEYLEPTA